LKHDYFDCIDKAKLPTKHKETYVRLIKEYLKMPLVLSHNDLSADNLIYTSNNKVIFIDYEWARLNNEYWDIANFIREVDLPLPQIKLLCKLMKITNIKKLLTFVYLTANYAYQWTFNMPLTNKIKAYRIISFKRMERYYRFTQL
jgi:thiamine kinase-like enzyme